MPTDGHYSHSARLGTPSHHVAGQHHQQPRRQHARGGAAAPPQHHIASTSGASASASASGTASASASSSATPHHLLNTVLIDDAATSGLNIERITRRANVHSIDASRGHGGPRMGYAFPETYDDPDTLQQQKETYFGMLQGSVRAGRLPWDGGLNGSSGDPWGWADEEVKVPLSHLPPPPTDDLLPSEAHSSYPFGRPYLAVSGQHPRASTLKPTPRTWMAEAKAWNGVAAATSGGDHQNSNNNKSSASDDLPAYLASKQAIHSVPNLASASSTTPDVAWPFVPFGPGQLNWRSVLSQRHVDAQRQKAYSDATSLLQRDAWYELALEELLPRGGTTAAKRSRRRPHPALHSSNGKSKFDLAAETDASSSSLTAFYAEAEREMALFEAQLKDSYGGGGQDGDSSTSSDGDDREEDVDDDGTDEDEYDEDDADEDADDDDDFPGQSAERKASKQLKRLLAAGGAAPAPRHPAKTATAMTTTAAGTDELHGLLTSLQLKRAGSGASGSSSGGGGGGGGGGAGTAADSRRPTSTSTSVFVQRARQLAASGRSGRGPGYAV